MDEKVNFYGYGIEGIVQHPAGWSARAFCGGWCRRYPLFPILIKTRTEREDNKIAADYGAGLKYFLSENWALRADVRHVIPID